MQKLGRTLLHPLFPVVCAPVATRITRFGLCYVQTTALREISLPTRSAY